jgi:hypothetical protein
LAGVGQFRRVDCSQLVGVINQLASTPGPQSQPQEISRRESG